MLNFQYRGTTLKGLCTGNEVGVIGMLNNKDVRACAVGDAILMFESETPTIDPVKVAIWKEGVEELVPFTKVSVWHLPEQERFALVNQLRATCIEAEIGPDQGCIGWGYDHTGTQLSGSMLERFAKWFEYQKLCELA